MPTTIAFDVYGTLIDTHGIVLELEKLVGEQAQHFSQTWRDKQLEYSFRRGLMQNYVDFSVVTRQALDYACLACQQGLTSAEREHLLEQYRTLPAFSDAKQALEQLKAQNHRLFAFSNGRGEAVTELLQAAGLDAYFQDIISVDELKSFKPNPAVYCHFLRSAQTNSETAWLVSSNPFDVLGAMSAGMRAAWVKRSGTAIFDPWGIEPNLTVSSLVELEQTLNA